jgi:hypothetical protein
MRAPNKNTHHCVKNIKNTASPVHISTASKSDSSWLSTWQTSTGSQRKTCGVVGCSGPAGCGAHVKSTDHRKGQHWYVVPMCKGHNHPSNREEMFLGKSVKMAKLT